jgi:hypothetical protein
LPSSPSLVILFGKAESSLFDRARTNVADWMRPALSATRVPMQVVGRWMGSIGEIFFVYQENLRLKEENARLKQWHNTALILDERLKRYQLLLHAVPDPAMSAVVARVIGRANHPFLQTMILDAGRANGVKPGQAVIDQRGMIGRIYLTGERTSWVILLTDLNSRVPVSIEPNTDQAIMAGDNSPNAGDRDPGARRPAQGRRPGGDVRRRRHSSGRHPDRRRGARGQRLSRRLVRRPDHGAGCRNRRFQAQAGASAVGDPAGTAGDRRRIAACRAAAADTIDAAANGGAAGV